MDSHQVNIIKLINFTYIILSLSPSQAATSPRHNSCPTAEVLLYWPRCDFSLGIGSLFFIRFWFASTYGALQMCFWFDFVGRSTAWALLDWPHCTVISLRGREICFVARPIVAPLLKPLDWPHFDFLLGPGSLLCKCRMTALITSRLLIRGCVCLAQGSVYTLHNTAMSFLICQISSFSKKF